MDRRPGGPQSLSGHSGKERKNPINAPARKLTPVIQPAV